MKNVNELLLGENETRIIHKLKDAAKSVLPDSTVILFGSRARGNAAADSDWDVLVLTQTVNHAIEQDVYKRLYSVELDENIIINVLVIEREDWDFKRFAGHPMKKNVEAEGILVA